MNADKLAQIDALGKLAPAGAALTDTVLDMLLILLQKNHDYDASALKSPDMAPEVPVQTALLVRISDKLLRMKKLRRNPAQTTESYEDAIRDLAGYFLLLLHEIRAQG
jgi:hypothetical protein